MADFPEDPDQPSRALTIWIGLSAVIVVAVGIWAFMNRDFSSDVTQAATAVGEAATAVAEAVEPLINSATTETPAAEAPAEPAAAPPKAAGPRRAAKAADTAPAPIEPLTAPVTMVPSEGPANSRAVSGTALPPLPPDHRGAVFDANDNTVVPPSLVMPLSNAPLPRETLKSVEPLAIEILVNPDGTVASARVMSDPATVAQALQVVNALSIAKSWTFGPAKKDGQAVQYRMWIALDKVLMWRSTIKSQ